MGSLIAMYVLVGIICIGIIAAILFLEKIRKKDEENINEKYTIWFENQIYWLPGLNLTERPINWLKKLKILVTTWKKHVLKDSKDIPEFVLPYAIQHVQKVYWLSINRHALK